MLIDLSTTTKNHVYREIFNTEFNLDNICKEEKASKEFELTIDEKNLRF